MARDGAPGQGAPFAAELAAPLIPGYVLAVRSATSGEEGLIDRSSRPERYATDLRNTTLPSLPAPRTRHPTRWGTSSGKGGDSDDALTERVGKALGVKPPSYVAARALPICGPRFDVLASPEQASA